MISRSRERVSGRRSKAAQNRPRRNLSSRFTRDEADHSTTFCEDPRKSAV